METNGRMVELESTTLHVIERGTGAAVIVLHGGPGLDHMAFGDYFDPLAERYRLLLVDQRGHGRSAVSNENDWTLERLAADIGELARALGLRGHAVLGHSFGAFVALQHAVDEPDPDVATIVCGGVPSTRYFASVEAGLQRVEPPELRERVRVALEREPEVESADEMRAVINAEMPFLFAEQADARIAEYQERSASAICSPAVLRHFASNGYGGIEVEDRLHRIDGPMLVLAGRHDHICSIAAAEAITARVPRAELVILEHSGHFGFVEEQERFIAAVRRFLDAHLTA